MALRIPEAALREVRGAGHSPHLERPQLYAAALLDFLPLRADPTLDPPSNQQLSGSPP